MSGQSFVPLSSPRKSSALSRFVAEQLKDIEVQATSGALVEDIFSPASLVVVFGESGCGKSFFVSHMALHVATGWDWAGKATVAGAVVYITAEGATGFRRRMVAFRQRLRPAAEVPFYVIADAPDLGNADGEADDIILAIRQQIDGDVSLIVVDTMSRVMQGADENSARDVSILIANVGKITAALGSSVVLVHHVGKDTTRGARGSSVLRAAADTEILVEKTEAGRFARVTKQKDGEEGLALSFELEQVEVEGTDGDTSCIVNVGKWQAETRAARRSKVTGSALIALRALEGAVFECGEIPPASTLLSRTQRAVRMGVWRDACAKVQITEADTPDAKRKAFTRAAQKLQDAGFIGVFEEWVWIITPLRTDRTTPDNLKPSARHWTDGQDTPL